MPAPTHSTPRKSFITSIFPGIKSWTGTDQVRFYKLDGNTLTITTPLNKNFVDGREGRSILVWEKLGP